MNSIEPKTARPDADRAESSTVAPYSTLRLSYVLLLLFLAMTLSFADRQLINILIEPIKQEFGASDSEMGLLTGLAFVFFYVLLSLPIARLADRHSRRNILVVAIGFWSVMTACCGMAATFWQLALARFGVGTGEAGGGPTAQSMIADYVPPRLRSTAYGIFAASGPVGIVLSMYGGAVMSAHWGWRSTFICLGLFGIALAVLIATTLAEPKRGRFDAVAAATGSEPKVLEVLRALWLDPVIRLLTFASAATVFSAFAMSVWTPSFLMRVHDFTLIEAGMLLGFAGALGGMSGAVIGGVLADRLGARDRRWPLRIVAIGTALSIPMFLLQLCWPHADTLTIGDLQFSVFVLLCPLSAFFSAFMYGPVYAAIQQLVAPNIRAQAAACYGLVINALGMGLGPLFVGVISDALAPALQENSLRVALLATLFGPVLGTILYLRAARHHALILKP